MKKQKLIFAVQSGFLLITAAWLASCSAASGSPPPVSTAETIKAAASASALATRMQTAAKPPSATSTMLSTKLVVPTPTRSSPMLSPEERSQFEVFFYYGTADNWKRLYPVYTLLEEAGYPVRRMHDSDGETKIGYGGPACLDAIEDIQNLVRDLVDLRKVKRVRFSPDDSAYEEKHITIQITDESLFLGPAPTEESPFSPYLAPLLPEFAVARLGKGALNDVAVSPGGGELAVATPIGVYLYRMEVDGALPEMWFVPTTIPMTTVAFSADGSTLAVGSDNDLWWSDEPEPQSAVLLILDSATGTPLNLYPLGGRGYHITSLALSPDGTTAAAGFEVSMGETGTMDLGVMLVNLSSGEIKTFSFMEMPDFSGSPNRLAFSPDGTFLAVSADRYESVLILETAGGTLAQTLLGHIDEVRGVVFSPDGKTLASVDALGGVILWDTGRWVKSHTFTISDLKEIKTNSYYCSVKKSSRLAFSPDGTKLAAGMGDGKIRLWNIGTGTGGAMAGVHTSGLLALAFTPDGASLTSVSHDRSILLHNVSGGKTSRSYYLEGHYWMTSVEFSSDNKLAAAGEACGAVVVWDVPGRKPVRIFPTGPYAFSPDGKTIATGGEGNSIILWNTADWKQKKILHGHTDTVYEIAFSPDGKSLASGGADESLILWDAAAGTKRWRVDGIEGGPSELAFSPDGKTLAHIADQGPSHIVFRDPASGAIQGTLDYEFWGVSEVVYSPDGKYLAVLSFSSQINLFTPPDYEEGGHGDGGTDAAFSPDGTIGASGSVDMYFYYVHLWDPSSGHLYAALPGHTCRVTGVAFSPDGKTIASASLDGTILLWDLAAALGR